MKFICTIALLSLYYADCRFCLSTQSFIGVIESRFLSISLKLLCVLTCTLVSLRAIRTVNSRWRFPFSMRSIFIRSLILYSHTCLSFSVMRSGMTGASGPTYSSDYMHNFWSLPYWGIGLGDHGFLVQIRTTYPEHESLWVDTSCHSYACLFPMFNITSLCFLNIVPFDHHVLCRKVWVMNLHMNGKLVEWAHVRNLTGWMRQSCWDG